MFTEIYDEVKDIKDDDDWKMVDMKREMIENEINSKAN